VNLKPIFIFVFIIWVFCVYGCLSIKEVKTPDKHYYVLEYSQNSFRQKRLPYILKVKEFAVAPEYRGVNIVYQENQNQRQVYPYHRWWISPGLLISNCLKQDLLNSQNYKAVIGEASQLNASHTLEGTVEAIYEQDRNDAWYAVLDLNVILEKRDLSSGHWQVLFQDSFSAQKRAAQNKPDKVVQAMSLAMKEISHKIQEKLYKAMAQ